MEKIILDKIVPEVFAAEPPKDSQVWLRDVELRRGETVLVEARSGAGKTSLAAFIMGLRDDYRGRILYDATEARSLGPDGRADLRRDRIAYLPQNLDLFGELTARDNIRVKRELCAEGGLTDLERGAKRLGVEPWLDKRAGTLSAGQSQRVALLRALSQPFDFIILDEPVSHLDEANNRAAAELVTETARAVGAGIIVLSVGNRLALDYDRKLLL